MGKKNKPTIAEINKASREYWQRRNAAFDDLVEQHRSLLDSPERVLALMEGHEESLKADEAYSRTESAIQSSIAKHKRPKKELTHKGAVIDAMRLHRREGSTLPEFIDSAQNNSVHGLAIAQAKIQGLDDRYVVTVDELLEDKTVAFKTLKDWWREAEKLNRPD